MKMSAADQAAYPLFSKYVREQLPTVVNVPPIVQAMRKLGQLTKPKLKSALTWGHGPTIKVTPLIAAYGEFTWGVKSNEIRIDKTVVDDFEKGTGKRVARAGNVQLAGVTLLHELCHWADDQDGIDDPPYEEGDELEKLLYGGPIF